MDTDMLEDWLIRVGLLVTDFPQIREMDLNPVKGTGSDLYAVDARIIVDWPSSEGHARGVVHNTGPMGTVLSPSLDTHCPWSHNPINSPTPHRRQ